MAQNVSAPNAPIRRAQGKGSDFARSRQFEWLARVGIATRGVIYAIIGVLAIKLAFGSGGDQSIGKLDRAGDFPAELVHAAVRIHHDDTDDRGRISIRSSSSMG